MPNTLAGVKERFLDVHFVRSNTGERHVLQGTARRCTPAAVVLILRGTRAPTFEGGREEWGGSARSIPEASVPPDRGLKTGADDPI